MSDLIINPFAHGIAVPTFVDEVLADSPAGFWMLNDTSGTQATDLSGNGRHGTYVGSPTFSQTGIDGNLATSFDGVNDEVTIPFNSAFMPNASNGITCEIWYKGTTTGSNAGAGVATSQRGLLCANESSSHKMWLSSVDADGKARVHTDPSYEILGPGTGAAINNGSFHQVVWTITPAGYDAELFVDGASVATNTNGNDPGDGSPTIRIGKNNRATSNHYCPGVITGVAIYPSVLSPTRILAHYQAGT